MAVGSRLRACAVAIITLCLCVSAQGGAAASPGRDDDWRSTVAGLAARPYELNAVASKLRLGAALPAASTDDLGDRRVADVVADATTRYVDGARFASATDGRDAYRHDLHLASWLSSRQQSTPSSANLAAVSDLVMAARLSADAAIQDAEAALRGPAPAAADAARQLDQARKAYGQARESLGKGLPVPAVSHFGTAWRQAYDVLGRLGISYAGDLDQDGVVDRVELMLGSSPLSTDTDGDGLADGFETDALFGFSSPAEPDTDGDGTRDGEEDLDGDTLTALDEQDLGSSPTEPDTDRDRADDAAERDRGTRPRNADTDGDGLMDGVEPSTGTDPLVADTDGDGVLDGEEVLTQQADGIDGIRASLVGTGDLVSSFHVQRATGDGRLAGAGGQVGPAYDFSLSPPAAAGLQQAELTVPYDASKLGDADPRDLRLFYFDPEHGVWEPAADGQVVDTERRVVRATVAHFSTYAIFDIENWGETWSAQDDPCRGRTGGGSDVVLLDLAFVLDSSGSMSWNDPQGLRRTAAKNFVDALLPEDRAGVVDFDSWARVTQPLTTDHAAVKAAIDRIDDWGGTNIAAGVELGNDILINNGDPARARMAILLTDGEGYYDTRLTEQAKAYGITIYTIGLGSAVDETLLRSIATQTGGKYHQVETAEELPEVFRRISEDTGGDPRAAKDTDGDGLNDCVEIEGVLGGDLQRYTSDPSLADTDGDGLGDAEEVGEPTTGTALEGWFDLFVPAIPQGTVVYTVYSDPREEDSDGDGLTDPNEADLGSEPRDDDSDGDGIADGVEVETVGSAVDVRDTDGDGLRDGYEHDHRHDQGLSPLFHDEQVGKWTYASHFAKGMVLGDLWREDSLAWLAGNLASGAASFIPVYGWIAGGVADVRDAIGSAIHADWVGSGLSVVGVVPYAGDAVAIPGKAAKFVVRNPELADEALAFTSKLDDVPTDIRVKTLREVLGGDWDDLVGKAFSQEALLRLGGGRTDLAELAASTRRSGHVTGATADFFATGRRGEEFLEGLYGASTKGVDRQVWRSTKAFRGRGRYFDVFVDGVAHESKVGYVRWSKSVEDQIRKDAFLRQSDDTVEDVRWHFFASAASDTMGADRRVLDLLDELEITYTLHVP